MSEVENDEDKDPDFEPDFSTVEMADLRPEGSVGEGFPSEGGPMPSGANNVEHFGEVKYILQPYGSHYKPKPKRDRRTSLIWNKFSIINQTDQIAACNICDKRISFKSTSGNLKKHLASKHGFSVKLGVLPRKGSRMSEAEDDRDKDPDFEPDFSTVEMADLRADGSVGGFNSEGASMPSGAKNVEDVGQVKYIMQPSSHSSHYKPKPKKDRRTSLIWTKFTIINKKDQIAACNICDQRMSIRSTSGNLKKHLERKHGFSIKLGVLPGKRAPPKYITPTPRPNVSELAGISDEGITVKVVGEDGEEEHFQVLGDQFMTEEVVGEVQEHDYTSLEHHDGDVPDQLRIGKVRSLNETRSSQSRRDVFVPQRSYSHMDEKSKRKRIMELQMDCLENKKYNMQLEALLMEQQLNLPRSIFTQPLRHADTQTRSTQTEVGGSDTRVFYITDKRGGRPMQQLFAFQDLDDY